MGAIPRRIVTGHTDDGTSVILSDAEVPVVRQVEKHRVTFYEVWNTEASPAPIGTAPGQEPTQRDVTVPPAAGGTKVRICEFAPGSLDEHGLQSPMHRTETIDYGIVLSGEITLLLDDSEVTARAGDIVVQRGTDHAWANRGDEPARVAFILVDGAFDDDLRGRLPTGAVESLMQGDPES